METAGWVLENAGCVEITGHHSNCAAFIKAHRKMRVGTRPHAGAGANDREGDTKPSCFREGETFSARSLALATPELAHQQQVRVMMKKGQQSAAAHQHTDVMQRERRQLPPRREQTETTVCSRLFYLRVKAAAAASCSN